jgi:hypothetical protein
MKALTANFKHLYQRPAVLGYYLFFLTLLPVIILLPLKRPENEGAFAGYLLFSVIGGVLAGSLQLDVFSKPFSFCLPGHRKIPRKFILLIGMVINIPASLLFLNHPSLAPITIFSAFCLGMATFAGISLCIFSLKNIGFIGLFPPFIFILRLVEGPAFIERIIVRYPLLAIGLGIVSSIGLWKWLGNDTTYRTVCGKRVISSFDGWNRAKVKKLRDAGRAERWQKKEIKELTGTEKFFQSRIEGCDLTSKARYIWSILYSDCSNLVNIGHQKILMSILSFCFIIFFIVFAGYQPLGLPTMIYIFAIVYPFFYSGTVPLSMLLTLGRRERCYGHFFMMAVISIGITILTSSVSIGLVALSKMLPEIHSQGQTLTFHGPDLRFIYLPLLIMPFGFTLRTLFPKTSVIGIPLIMVVFLFGHSILGWLDMQHPVQITGLIVVAWLVLNLATRHRFMRTCLAGK